MSNPNPQLPATCPTCKNTRPAYDTCEDIYHRTYLDEHLGQQRDFKAEAIEVAKIHEKQGHDYQCSWCGAKPEFHKAAEAPTRVTVIPPKGLAQEWWNVKVRLDYQDDGRTLKIFMEER